MLFHERPGEGGAPDSGGATPSNGQHATHEAMRQRTEALLAAGIDAIDRALSRDHEVFLKASLQEGGQ